MVDVKIDLDRPILEADTLHLVIKLSPEELGGLGIEPEKIQAKIVAASNYISWLFSPQGSQDQEKAATGVPKISPAYDTARRQGSQKEPVKDKRTIDLKKANKRVVGLLEKELSNVKTVGNKEQIEQAELNLQRAKERVVKSDEEHG